MIEAMKKISLFLFYSEKKNILRGLQALGIVDLNVNSVNSERILHSLQKKSEFKAYISEIIKIFNSKSATEKIAINNFPDDISDQLNYLVQVFKNYNNLKSSIDEIKSDLATLQPWGNLPLDKLNQLKSKGLEIIFYSGSAKFFDQFDFQDLDIHVLSREKGTVRFVLFSWQKSSPSIPFQKYEFPSRTIEELEIELEFLQKKMLQSINEIAALNSYLPRLKIAIRHLNNRISFEEAKLSLVPHTSGDIFFIEGFFPANTFDKLIEFLDHHQVAYKIEQPGETDSVPVLLKNNKVIKLFEPITKIFSLPQYSELDPTPMFAPFFTIFFGLCLGDVGYGLIMLLPAIIFSFKKKYSSIGQLGLVLSFSTILAGVLLNSFFGAAFTDFVSISSEITMFAARTIDGKTSFPAMTLSLLLGTVQILVAFVIQSANEIKRSGWMYSLKSLGTLLIIFASIVLAAHHNFLNLGFNSEFQIGSIPVGAIVTSVSVNLVYIAYIVGFCLFFFFNSLQFNWLIRPLTGIWEFYQFVTGFLGDLLSYIRLFALGLASGLLANSFNQIAFMILPQNQGVTNFASPLIIVSIIILILGHTLNLALSALGSFVHPLRLTFVEFYKNIGFHGGGRAYSPFKKVHND